MTGKIECNRITDEIAQEVSGQLYVKLSQHEIYTKGEIFAIINQWVLDKYKENEK